jgi:hypothetical protein
VGAACLRPALTLSLLSYKRLACRTIYIPCYSKIPRKKRGETNFFQRRNVPVQTSALTLSNGRANADGATRHRTGNGRNGRPGDAFSSFFQPATQKAAQTSDPPRSLGVASQPREKNAAQAGAVPARLARAWLGGRGRYGGKQRVSPVRMGSGVAKLAAGGKAFPPEPEREAKRKISHPTNTAKSRLSRCGFKPWEARNAAREIQWASST